jgi:hypothetical protein
MKLILCILFFILIGCGSIQISGDSQIIELPGMSKNKIYHKAMQWITYKFVSGRAVMDYKDLVVGRIIAKGNLLISQPMGGYVEFFMMATIDCANGKSKINVEPAGCTAISPNGNRWPCSSGTMTMGALDELKIKPKEFIKDYREYMRVGKAPVWDGK